MIKRETLKQAIDRIARQDPEIGYALNEMLGAGQIDVAPEVGDAAHPNDFFFLFDNEKIAVKKYLFIHAGTDAVEERLLIKYGEMAKRQALFDHSPSQGYWQAALEIQQAGLRFLVRHEVDRALARLQQEDSPPAERLAQLKDIRQGKETAGIPRSAADPGALFAGRVGDGRGALFAAFPFCEEALMQVADINLEFFNVRFLLGCLADGSAKNLFICAVEGRIAGLIQLALTERLFYKGLTVKYIATLGGAAPPAQGGEPIRGVGTFLMAGTWLWWQSRHPDAREIILDAELGATRFYTGIGFAPRGPYQYVFKAPKGNLLRAIVEMADNQPELAPAAEKAVCRLISGQVRLLCKPPRRAGRQREEALVVVRACLAAHHNPVLARTAAELLLRHRRQIPETDDLLAFGARHGRLRLVEAAPKPSGPILGVAADDRFNGHLEDIFHLENAKRFRAIRSVLEAPELAGRWTALALRPALPAELGWVHTPQHIHRVAETAGRTLSTFDLDTQASAKSFDVACLAAGSVFSLLDAIQEGRVRRGFACLRPPGHHAEPDRAMGFCLFNNVALGARYLQTEYHLKRIMIVDIDAHHGNGTQKAFYASREVLFLSLHQFPGYPGTGNLGEVGAGEGEGYSVNVPLARGSGDRDFGQILHRLAAPLARAYQPEMILVSCGFDLYRHDPLGQLQGTPEGYGALTALLIEMAETVCQGRIAFVMEGGYSIMGIRDCGRQVLAALCGNPHPAPEKIDKIKNAPVPKFSSLRKAIEIQKAYWPILR